jgi:hypothetical protein
MHLNMEKLHERFEHGKLAVKQRGLSLLDTSVILQRKKINSNIWKAS